MRGVIIVDALCECNHTQSNHTNGRINTSCNSPGCHCSIFTAAPVKVMYRGKLIKVAWIES